MVIETRVERCGVERLGCRMNSLGRGRSGLGVRAGKGLWLWARNPFLCWRYEYEERGGRQHGADFRSF
jgi:hypothetical protein